MTNLLERLKAGEVIIGDGSYSHTLEKRGYILAACWTPECTVEHPEAVRQLAIEYARAGADITQTCTFYSDDKRLKELHGENAPTCEEINQAACKIAKEIGRERGTIVAGGISETKAYSKTKNKELTIEELRKATQVLVDNDVDLILCEFFRNIEEMEWAIEHARTLGKPVAATMAISPKGDDSGVTIGECAVRMAKAGPDLLGLNCLFDPFIMLESMKIIKDALDKEGLKPFLMAQPLGYRTPDGGPFGWNNLDEYPYALEPRHITRIEAMKFARAAYDLGVRYIGGCCGFESYHIRAMAEELKNERGKLPEASEKSELGRDMFQISKRAGNTAHYHKKDTIEYWKNLIPATGRPASSSLCKQNCPQAVPDAFFQ